MSTRPRVYLASVLAIGLLTVAPTAASVAQDYGTAEEAKALVARAIALYDEAGREAAFAAIEDPDGALVDRDLYIFVFGPERAIVAHGGDPDLVGTEASTLVDVDGVRFGDLFMDDATEDGAWVDYRWTDPITGEVLPKRSWVVLHDGHVFGAGIYRR